MCVYVCVERERFKPVERDSNLWSVSQIDKVLDRCPTCGCMIETNLKRHNVNILFYLPPSCSLSIHRFMSLYICLFFSIGVFDL